MMMTKRLLLAALTISGLAGAAGAQVVTHDLFYTRFGVDNPGVDSNVKQCVVSYDRATHQVTINNIQNIAYTLGADGITFATDGDLLVGGQATGRLFKINRTTHAQTNQPTGQTDSFHVKLDPSGQKAWTAGLPSSLAEVPLNPFAPGTMHTLTGDDTLITDITWAAGKVFYTASGTNGHGNFGEINLTTFVTTRRLTDVDYAHGIQLEDVYKRQGLLILGAPEGESPLAAGKRQRPRGAEPGGGQINIVDPDFVALGRESAGSGAGGHGELELPAGPDEPERRLDLHRPVGGEPIRQRCRIRTRRRRFRRGGLAQREQRERVKVRAAVRARQPEGRAAGQNHHTKH